MKVLIGVLIASFFLASCAGGNDADMETFAECLAESGAVMYGAYWCPHCTAQKQMFGTSFKKVNYVECSLPNREGQTEECTQAGISGYPTWEFEGGTRRTGAITLSELSRESGCIL